MRDLSEVLLLIILGMPKARVRGRASCWRARALPAVRPDARALLPAPGRGALGRGAEGCREAEPLADGSAGLTGEQVWVSGGSL